MEGLWEKFRMELDRVGWRIGLYLIVCSRGIIREYRRIPVKKGFINSSMCESRLHGERGLFVTLF